MPLRPSVRNPANPPEPEAQLSQRLRTALGSQAPASLDALSCAEPFDARDRFETLLVIYDLHLAPLERVGAAARWQHHPAVAAIKSRCEAQWLAELQATATTADEPDAAAAMRALAARDRLPDIYRWVAHEASHGQLATFLALEGGPDAGFDDLVALCQVGLHGGPKLELAANYWDEMGNGDPSDVHTALHDTLVHSLDLPRIPMAVQPVSALARTALNGLLATNRWLQPELLGALGLTELQAGPRCRLVLQGLRRCGAPAAAYPFYQVHADVDPRHGKDWLDNAITPVVARHPHWGIRIVRGAHWRSATNAAFMTDVARLLGSQGEPTLRVDYPGFPSSRDDAGRPSAKTARGGRRGGLVQPALLEMPHRQVGPRRGGADLSPALLP